MPRILSIDDQPLFRPVLRSILERNGHTVQDAPDGRAGLALPPGLVQTALKRSCTSHVSGPWPKLLP